MRGKLLEECRQSPLVACVLPHPAGYPLATRWLPAGYPRKPYLLRILRSSRASAPPPPSRLSHLPLLEGGSRRRAFGALNRHPWSALLHSS